LKANTQTMSSTTDSPSKPTSTHSEDPHPDDFDSPEICPKVYSLSDDVDHKEMAAMGSARQFTLFEHQVAGTLPMLHCDGMLYKPLKAAVEQTFYKNIVEWLPAIEPFIPRYSGLQYIEIMDTASAPKQLLLRRTDHDGVDPLPSAMSAMSSLDSSVVLENEGDGDCSASGDGDGDGDGGGGSGSGGGGGGGVHSVSARGQQHNPWSSRMFKKNGHRIAKTPFLILEDVTASFRRPSVLDLKVGTRHFAAICGDVKMQRKLRKSWCSTCQHFGVRLGGVQRFDRETERYHIVAKDEAMGLDRNAFTAELASFFRALPRRQMLQRFISKLQRLYNVLENERRFRWFSCSLLFVFEGATGGQSAERTDLRLIDFTNFVVVEQHLDALMDGVDGAEDDGVEHSDDSNHSKEEAVAVDVATDEEEDKEQGPEQGPEHGLRRNERLQLSPELDTLEQPDHGILFGLESLIALLGELRSTETIRRRSDDEWDRFKANRAFSEMALLPFSDKELFNEHTTIH